MFKNAIFNGKAAIVKEQIDDRILRGAKTLELQLLNELNENEEINYALLQEIDVSVIHMPLVSNIDFPIEHIEGQKAFIKVCEIANKIANIKNHEITIVLHMGISTNEAEKLGILENIKNIISEQIEKYPLISIALENPTAYNYSSNGTFEQNSSLAIYDNKLHFSNIELAKIINHPRCGVCIDVCHILMDERNLKWSNKVFDKILDNSLSPNTCLLDECFKQAKPYIKLIHLSYPKQHGYGQYHGLPYSPANHIVLQYISNLYEKNCLNCPITIETTETDINNAVNYSLTMKTILSEDV